jgi:two-component system, OmpR family, sensor histidine kinase CpxA
LRIFIRLLLSFWAVTFVLTVTVVFVDPPNSSLQDGRLRTLPLNALQVCAANAADKYRTGGAQALIHQATGCYDGLLLMPGTIPVLDLAGRILSRDEHRVALRAQHSTDAVVMPSPKGTTIALRSDPTSPTSYIFVATVAQPGYDFTMLRIGMFGRMVLLSGILSLLVTAYFVRPITRLNAVAEQFGAGDLKARTSRSLSRRKDELGDLGRTFNQMAERIESLIVRYKNFLAHASHELGSPLTRLNIALALAKRKAGHQLEPEHDRIGQEADRLNSLVQELLLLARLESGNELSRNPVLFDIGELVEEACGDARFEATQAKKTVTIVTQQTFQVRGYPDLLRRALDNLLRNGLRFAKNEGCVEVSYFLKDGLATGVIVVQDDGPGISAGQEESIFEPFVTLPNDENAGGSGLGLAIARQAVLANGGTTVAQSSAGSGLTVTIELPARLIVL